MPKVSIIIPTYNRANLLPRSIKSILNQTFKDFELIIVDDGSTDNTKEVVEEFQKKDSRIKYIRREVNSGGAAIPCNLGIKNSQGEYIAFVGSDDECLPEWLEKQMKCFEKSDKVIDVVSCDVIRVDLNGRRIGVIAKPRKTTSDEIIRNLFLPHVTVGNIVIRKVVLEKIGGYDENLIVHEDWDLWLRLVEADFKFKFVNEELYVSYFHLSSTSAIINPLVRIKNIKYFLEKHKDIYSRYPKGKAKVLRHLGNAYCLGGFIKEGSKCFLEAIRLNPLDFRNYLNLIICLGGGRFFRFIRKIRQYLPFEI